MADQVKIKFCGMMRPEDIAAANAVRPDCVGFIFWPKARRYVAPEQAAVMRSKLLPGIRAVGVFVDEDPEKIRDIAARVPLDMIQLHGSETEETITKVKEAAGLPVMKAFVIRSADDLKRAEKSCADLVLLDSGKGSGRTFSWELLRAFSKPYFLAGGLTPENVGEAVRTYHPYGVDASSSLETDGKKDPAKMRAFAAAVRSAG